MTGNSYLRIAGISISSMLMGAGIGYLVAQKRLEKHYLQMVNEEIKDAKEYYETKLEEAETGVIKEYYNTVKKYDGETAEEPVEEPAPMLYDKVARDQEERTKAMAAQTIRNVFHEEPPPAEPDYTEEIAARQRDIPYIISQAEFFENEPNHEQTNLTLYLKDSTLADERDDIIDDTDRTTRTWSTSATSGWVLTSRSAAAMARTPRKSPA
jgi:hypothetical protein